MSIFQTKEYLDLFARHFVPNSSSIANSFYEILPDKRAVLLGMKPVLNSQEVTDYGDISNPTEEMIQQHMNDLKKNHGVLSVQYNYVREDSLLFPILSKLSPLPPASQEVSPYIVLPSTWEEYLESLERTDRKELKRKFKRLDTVPHSFRYFDSSHKAQTKGEEDFEEFITLHKLSDRNKEQFMSPPMKAFFKDLLYISIPGWQQKIAFLTIQNKPAASVFYFENESHVLLYNSGYDPEQKQYSGGLLLIAHLIEESIKEKKEVFDFLRGNERYKYDLGAKDCKLYQFIFMI